MEAQEGDPKYLAPEILAGKFDKPADIFRWTFSNIVDFLPNWISS